MNLLLKARMMTEWGHVDHLLHLVLDKTFPVFVQIIKTSCLLIFVFVFLTLLQLLSSNNNQWQISTPPFVTGVLQGNILPWVLNTNLPPSCHEMNGWNVFYSSVIFNKRLFLYVDEFVCINSVILRVCGFNCPFFFGMIA